MSGRFRTLRIRRDTYEELQALRLELTQRGLGIVPLELLPDLPDGGRGQVTVSLTLGMAINALRGFLREEGT